MKVESKLVIQEGLRSVFDVVVKAEEVNQQLTKELNALQKKVKIKGFRTGKVPFSTVQKMYGQETYKQVAEDLIRKSCNHIISQESSLPALSPDITNAKVGDNGDLTYRLEVEFLPKIKSVDLSKLNLNRVRAKVSNDSVEEEITKLIKSVPLYKPLTEPRSAREGDLLTISLQIYLNKKLVHEKENFELVLGSKTLPKALHNELLDKLVGEQAEVKTKIEPHGKVSAGTRTFLATIKSIKEAKPQESKETLAETFGMQDVTALEDWISKQLESKYKQIADENEHRQFLKFLETVELDLPEKLIKSEVETIIAQLGQKPEAKLENAYWPLATRRVKLGVLVASIANDRKLAVDKTEAANFLRQEALKYGDQAEAFLEMVTKDSFARNRVLAPLIEQCVFETARKEAIIEQHDISEKEILELEEALSQELEDSFKIDENQEDNASTNSQDVTAKAIQKPTSSGDIITQEKQPSADKSLERK